MEPYDTGVFHPLVYCNIIDYTTRTLMDVIYLPCVPRPGESLYLLHKIKSETHYIRHIVYLREYYQLSDEDVSALPRITKAQVGLLVVQDERAAAMVDKMNA